MLPERRGRIPKNHDEQKDQERPPPSALDETPAAPHRGAEAGILNEHHRQDGHPTHPDPYPERQEAYQDSHEPDEEDIAEDREVSAQHGAQRADDAHRGEAGPRLTTRRGS